jgi:hypothetical protein
VLALALGAVVVAIAVGVGNSDAVETALHRRGVHLVLVAGVLLLQGFLLFGRSGSRLLDGIAVGVGAVLVSFLGFAGQSGALSLTAALLFALSAAVAIFSRPRDEA